MSVIFTNLAWAGLLALVAVPILVHLFARTKPPGYRFSDNRFLRKIIKKTARFQKPQDLIILMLRCLAALAILAAFLQPLLVATNEGDSISDKKAVVLVVDRSASMAASEGATSRYDRAVQAAQSILKESNFDLANIVWIDAEPDAVFPEVGQNTKFLETELGKSQASYENGAIERAVKLALDQVEGIKGSKKIVVISDFQKANWQDLELNIPKGVSFETLTISEKEVSNMAVSDLHTSPAQPILGEPVEIIATVANYSGEDRRAKVYMDTGGGRSTREVDVPAWSSTQVIHQVQLSKAGEMVLSARLEEDGFPGDDICYSSLQVRDRLRVALVGENIPDPLERLGQALPWLEISKVATLDQAGVYDFVYVDQWNGEDRAKIKELLANGVSVLVQPDVRIEAGNVGDLFGSDDPGSLALQEKKEGWTIIVADSKHKAMKLFETGEYGVPGEGRHSKRLAIAKKIPGMATVLKYNDGVPALLRKKKTGEGALLFFNMPLDRESSDWSERTSFVSFMAEVFLAERMFEIGQGYSLPGVPIGYFPAGGIDKNGIKLVHGKESLELKSSETNSGLQLVSSPISRPGVYRWMVGKDNVKVSAVNLVETESDLRTIAPDELRVGDVVTTKQLLRRASLGDGVNLWGLLIGLAILFLMIELVVVTLKPKGRPEKA